jgi:hypothetical protein
MFKKMQGHSYGKRGVDNDLAAPSFEKVGLAQPEMEKRRSPLV